VSELLLFLEEIKLYIVYVLKEYVYSDGFLSSATRLGTGGDPVLDALLINKRFLCPLCHWVRFPFNYISEHNCVSVVCGKNRAISPSPMHHYPCQLHLWPIYQLPATLQPVVNLR